MKKEDTRYRVGITGSYGGLNLGDEAILQSVIAELRRSLPVRITVFSRDADDTRRRHGVEHSVAVRNMSRDEVAAEIEGLDLLIVGGGGILYDGEAHVHLREAAIANEKGVPVMVYAVGAGPLKDPKEQQTVREALEPAAVVTVRERRAQQALEEAGLKREVIVTADPALLLQPEPMDADTVNKFDVGGRRLVAMSVREPGSAAPDLDEQVYHSLLANVADFIVDRFDADIVMIPLEPRHLDLQHSHAVIARMLQPQRAFVLKGDFSPGQVLWLMGRCAFAVGMRLHFLIFAALQSVPFVALPYASKVSGFLERLGIDTPPLQLVNAGRVIAHLDRSWDRRSEAAAKLKGAVEALKKEALRTNEMAVEVLTRKRAGAGAGAAV